MTRLLLFGKYLPIAVAITGFILAMILVIICIFIDLGGFMFDRDNIKDVKHFEKEVAKRRKRNKNAKKCRRLNLKRK